MNKVNKIIIISRAFGNVAGWIPLLSIGGTISKVKVTKSNIEEKNIIIKETKKESLKKKGKLLFALLLFCTSFI